MVVSLREGLEISKVLISLSQWCLGHLQDQQLVDYLERCMVGIVPGGVIVVKENIAPDPDDIYDEADSSVTRYFIFFPWSLHQAGLTGPTGPILSYVRCSNRLA